MYLLMKHMSSALSKCTVSGSVICSISVSRSVSGSVIRSISVSMISKQGSQEESMDMQSIYGK